MPKVSVIIPVYGVEKYIERCVDSLFKQTLDDVEYIFVDDCTVDRSIELLEQKIEKFRLRFAESKKVARIVRMPSNSGQAAVRRVGLQLAKGDYIIHCDSDDWIDPDMCRAMYEKAITEKADVVVCDYYVADGQGNNTIKVGCHDTNKENFIENMLFLKDSWVVWNKLIKRDLYECNSLIYPVDAMGEDMVLSLQLLWYSKKISYVRYPYYYYYVNSLSITKNSSVEKCLLRYGQLKRNTDKVVAFFNDKYRISRKMQDGLIFIQYFVKEILLPVVYDKQYFKLWKSTYPNITLPFLKSEYVPLSLKLKYLLTFVHLYPKKDNRIL